MFNLEKFNNLEEFRAWLRTVLMREFEYLDVFHCVHASWAMECGAASANASCDDVTVSKKTYRFPDWMERHSFLLASDVYITGETALAKLHEVLIADSSR